MLVLEESYLGETRGRGHDENHCDADSHEGYIPIVDFALVAHSLCKQLTPSFTYVSKKISHQNKQIHLDTHMHMQR